ncbi:MAG TPA: hypothetical protein VMW40_07130 [Candidatus Bathyarchaeia archaeon]|nr:hypothetical protein [Candidatus Bathyarchaeia archaeon]
MEDKERFEKALGAIDLKELGEMIEKSNRRGRLFEEHYAEFLERYAGKIVAVSDSGKIASVPFTKNVAEAKRNFKTLERKLGKENLRAAASYIPEPNKVMLL